MIQDTGFSIRKFQKRNGINDGILENLKFALSAYNH